MEKIYKYLLFGQKFDLYTDYQALRGIFNNKSDDDSSRIVKLLSKTTDYFPYIFTKKVKIMLLQTHYHAHIIQPILIQKIQIFQSYKNDDSSITSCKNDEAVISNYIVEEGKL